MSYGGETGTVGFSVDWRVGRGSRHVGYGCLVEQLGDDQLTLGHRCTVVDCDRRCIVLGESNALRYGGETGTIRFYVIRRVRNDGRHVMNGCLVAMLGDDQCA